MYEEDIPPVTLLSPRGIPIYGFQMPVTSNHRILAVAMVTGPQNQVTQRIDRFTAGDRERLPILREDIAGPQ